MNDNRSINENLKLYIYASKGTLLRALFLPLDQYSIAMVNFVLDDLGRPALKGLDARLHLLILVLHLNFSTALGGPRAAQQAQAAFFRLVLPCRLQDHGVEHRQIFSLGIYRNDILAHTDHIGRHAHAGFFMVHQRFQ